MQELDTVLLLQAAEYLKPKDFNQLKQTCRAYNALLNNTATTARVLGNSDQISSDNLWTFRDMFGMFRRGVSDMTLIIACKIRRIDIIWRVINKGIAEKHINETMYHVARGNHIECVKYLMNHLDLTEFDITNALCTSIEEGHLECIRLLINYPSIREKSIRQILKFAIRKGRVGSKEIIIKKLWDRKRQRIRGRSRTL